MTEYTRIRNTIMSNPGGVMDSTLCLGLQTRVKSNVRLYFYKYNIYDLVEIKFEDDLICVYDFVHTEDKATQIKDNLTFFAGYFKSAGLEGKRFLFNILLKIPVNYVDFVEMDSLPYPEHKDFAFIVDRKEGYVHGLGEVNVFVATERTNAIDKSVLSFVNNSIGVKYSKNIERVGCISSILISGLLTGMSPFHIKEQADIVDEYGKFMAPVRGMEFNSAYVNNIMSKLKIDKVKKVIQKNLPDKILNGEIVDKEVPKGRVSLRNIIEVGLDKCMKFMDNPKEVVKVDIDCEHQTIRSAYIVGGCMFITPVTMIPLSYFSELLNSDNIQYVLN